MNEEMKDYNRVRVSTWPELWSQSIVLFLEIKTRDDERFYLGSDLSFHHLSPAEEPQYCFRLKPDEAQILADSLWASGIRPIEGMGSAGQLGAVEGHLADMRKLVEKFAEVNLIGG